MFSNVLEAYVWILFPLTSQLFSSALLVLFNLCANVARTLQNHFVVVLTCSSHSM